jgi:uncharacterized membrane protein
VVQTACFSDRGLKMSDSHEATEPALERFVFFSDAVFAIAITLLALEIKVPVMPADSTEAAWEAALLALTPSFFAFGLSFFVIGSVWTAHHGVFRLVAGFDQRFMAPNMLLLLAIVLVPFSSGLLTASSRVIAPFAFYSAVLLLAGVSKAWLTMVVTRPKYLRPDVTSGAATNARRRSLLLPTAALLAFGLAFVKPAWNNLAMLLLSAARLPIFNRRA